jgi:16S rRNA U516 pseudouridylate synthase RsuA-like enzyme
MAKISSTKKLVLEDYPAEVRPWLRKMIDPLNRFLEQAYFALVQGLTTKDNLKAQSNSVTVASGQTYPIKVAWNLNERPTAVFVASISDSTGAAVQPYAMEWLFNNGQVEVTLTGLAANEHKLTLLGLV